MPKVDLWLLGQKSRTKILMALGRGREKKWRQKIESEMWLYLKKNGTRLKAIWQSFSISIANINLNIDAIKMLAFYPRKCNIFFLRIRTILTICIKIASCHCIVCNFKHSSLYRYTLIRNALRKTKCTTQVFKVHISQSFMFHTFSQIFFLQ